KPAMAEQYETAVREFLAVLKQNNISNPMFTGYTFQSTGFCYTTATPIGNWSDLDKMNTEMPEVEQKIGKQRIDDFTRRMGNAIDHSSFMSARELPEISYHPTQSAPNLNEKFFVHYDLFYITPGRHDDAIEIAKAWKKLYETHQIPQGYTVFSVGFGTELPLIIVERTAKTQAEYVAQMDQETRTFGGAQKQLAQRWNEITRRYESRNAYFRPDLSYMPNQPTPQPVSK
ncbi:MAG: hypothetical protein JO187_07185, partial [Acidobacteria bacterium]|nr:hypothetical protein [Acidobacteriota bacterium]